MRLWRETHLEVKMVKAPYGRTTFGRLKPFSDVEMLTKCMPLWREDAWSTFASKKCKTDCPGQLFWTLRCQKKCTPLWHGARSHVKNADNWRPRTTFGRWKLKKRMLLWCEGHLHVQSVKNWRLARFWTWRCRKSAQRCSAGHIRKSKVSKSDGLGPLLDVGDGSKKIVKDQKIRDQKRNKLGIRKNKLHMGQVKSVKNERSRAIFGRWDDEKVQAVVARNTFATQKR
jgi:hypothetical protein